MKAISDDFISWLVRWVFWGGGGGVTDFRELSFCGPCFQCQMWGLSPHLHLEEKNQNAKNKIQEWQHLWTQSSIKSNAQTNIDKMSQQYKIYSKSEQIFGVNKALNCLNKRYLLLTYYGIYNWGQSRVLLLEHKYLPSPFLAFLKKIRGVVFFFF